jgi:hypothetical protein
MEAVAEKFYTLEEYFAFCEKHEGRFEFVNGQILECRRIGNGQSDRREYPHISAKSSRRRTIHFRSKMQSDSRFRREVFRIPDFLIFKESGNQTRLLPSRC